MFLLFVNRQNIYIFSKKCLSRLTLHHLVSVPTALGFLRPLIFFLLLQFFPDMSHPKMQGKNFFPAVEKGLRDSIKKGVLAGYPMVGITQTLFYCREEVFRNCAADNSFCKLDVYKRQVINKNTKNIVNAMR